MTKQGKKTQAALIPTWLQEWEKENKMTKQEEIKERNKRRNKMSFTIAVFGKFKIILKLLDVDPSDGNIAIGIELSWK